MRLKDRERLLRENAGLVHAYISHMPITCNKNKN